MRVDLDDSAVLSVGPAAGAVSAAFVDVLVGAAAAPGPHLALRKSFQVMPLSVLAVCAARYFTLHSCMLNACAGMFHVIATTAVVAKSERERIDIAHELHGCVACERHWHNRSCMESKRRRCWQRKMARAVYGRRMKFSSFK